MGAFPRIFTTNFMKIVQIKLKKYIEKSGLSIVEITKRMNAIQDVAYPGRRPMTINSIYLYLDGHTPPLDKIYYLSAILKAHPSKIFGIVYDEDRLTKIKEVATQIKL